PNPFSSSAVLEFSTGRAGHVLVELYDLLGRRAAVVSDGFLPAGPHVEQFTTNGLAAGPYVLVVRTEDARIVRPISVIR
ncbi:MAG: T9SS type A sorting domain-containing protein, partial [Rhodothermales bacterium]